MISAWLITSSAQLRPAAQRCAVPCPDVPCRAVGYCAMPCGGVLCDAVRCCAVRCCAVLCRRECFAVLTLILLDHNINAPQLSSAQSYI